MPTLYVENVPEPLYDALRRRAQRNRSSISTEVLSLLAETVPTPAILARRKTLIERASKIRSRRAAGPGPFPSTEQMLREDRAR
jgi:plasmid stability protein